MIYHERLSMNFRDYTQGLLTDGNQWILKKNFEVFHKFSSLSDLRNDFIELYKCIGREPLLTRMKLSGSPDIVTVIFVPFIFRQNLTDGIELAPEELDLTLPIGFKIPDFKENVFALNSLMPVIINIVPQKRPH